MPSNMSEERKKMFHFYGAELIEAKEGDFDEAIRMRNELCYTMEWFNCNQFDNPLNIKAHCETTGPEIYGQYDMYLNEPAVFVAGTGTGGTLMGVSNYLRTRWKNIKIVAVEPEESPVMSGGEAGLHGIQGIGDGSKFLVDLDCVDEVKTVETECAKKCRKTFSKKIWFIYRN